MLKIYITLVVLVVSLYSSQPVKDTKLIQQYFNEIRNMDGKQHDYITIAYEECSEYDLSLTCVSIAIQESKAGKYLFNPTTGDYGLMGLNLYTFKNFYKLKSGYYKDIKIASMLITDTEFNIHHSVKVLQFWQKKNYSWYKMVASYNGGYKPNYKYANNVYHYMLAYKRYRKYIGE